MTSNTNSTREFATEALVSPSQSTTLTMTSSTVPATGDSTSTSPSSLTSDSTTSSDSISTTSDSSTSASPSTAVTTSSTTATPSSPTTRVTTSVITTGHPTSGTDGGTTVVVITTTGPGTTAPPSSTPADSITSSSASSSTSTGATLQNNGSSSSSSGGGLSKGGTVAVAVVVPVAVVALLLLGGIMLWKKRKSKKTAEEARRKEVEEYGFNPNNDPTLPAVASESPEMAEDTGGYRGWGNSGAGSTTRQPSTTLSGGIGGVSETGSNPGGSYHNPNSPGGVAGGSDGHSGDPLVNSRRETQDSDNLGQLGAIGGAPVAGAAKGDVHRGPSNASSSYSHAARSSTSDGPPIPGTSPQDYYPNDAPYSHGPYGDGTYGGGQGEPIVRDVAARRNTRIENPSVRPAPGNSGIAQNF